MSFPARPSRVSAESLPSNASLALVPLTTRLKMKLLAVRVLARLPERINSKRLPLASAS
ncbi:hypothetical protein D3C77_790400 [compost metagenome]